MAIILKDRIALVTGAGSGIGQATALRFAREGAMVVIGDINERGARETVDKIKDAGGKAEGYYLDVAASGQVSDFIDRAVKEHGRIDILYNNAGMEVFNTVAGTSEEDWERTINVNLKGVFLGMKYALPIMQEQGHGNILNMASIAGLAAWPGLGVYSAAKGGIVLLTKAAAAEYGKFGIRINCLCPGSIMTPLLEEQFFGAMENPEEAKKQLLKNYPLNRLGRVEEIAGAALFLVSEESSFITGHALAIDGGLSCFVGDLI